MCSALWPERHAVRRAAPRWAWDRRVFAGGAYRAKDHQVEVVVDVVRRLGFDAVATWDFEIPNELSHHHSLMLLHECRSAIFDVNSGRAAHGTGTVS
jgi:hypothetical protein